MTDYPMDTQYPLLANSKENQDLLRTNICDKYDYLAAVGCGAIGGIVDIFLVGTPGDSILGKWTDDVTNNVVMVFAKKMGWDPRKENKHNVHSAIGFLERKFKVNYDQRKSSDVNNLFDIAPSTHHMMSLAHSPDVLGLFFSILNQFTSTSSFIANGQLITISTDTFELQGGNFIMKILCGIANWFCHLMSDVAGSSGSHQRGTGIVMPFYELFGLCKFGKFTDGNEKKDLAEIAMKAFTEGYDFRFGMAQAIPVIITELTIRLIWAIRRRFQKKMPIKECIPTMKHKDLRVMLLIGNGTLCVMDAVDAGVRSGGTFIGFFMRLNLVAWCRLLSLVLKEVLRRIGIVDRLDETIEAFARINQALNEYLKQLEMIDVAQFEEDTKAFNNFVDELESVDTEEKMKAVILTTFEKLGINTPWNGDFDTFMSNPNNKLSFT